MKKIVATLSILIGLSACNQKPEGYTLTGTLEEKLKTAPTFI
ncbi:lipoprotein [Winogradskyella maritima]|nr:lipoprotein [Winogradskyella maritima]